MSDQQANGRKPSSNKNIKKLRAISMVCGLTSSWQQWVTDNEKKQANEPSGWSPSSLGGSTEEPTKSWMPKERPPAGPAKVRGSKEDTQGSSTSGAPNPEGQASLAEPAVGSLIKVKPVVRTVTAGVQEKGAGISLLTQKIQRDSLPSEQDLDRFLKKRSSPTLRRKCSNMVSSMAKSWKQAEEDQNPEEEAAIDTRVCEGDEAERQAEGDPTQQGGTGGDAESTLRIKRPSAPV